MRRKYRPPGPVFVRRRGRRAGGYPRRAGSPFRLILIVFSIAALILLARAATRLSPTVRALAGNVASRAATEAIYESVQSVLSSEDVEYSQLVIIEKNTMGDIISVRTNMHAANLLTARLTLQINERLAALESLPLGIPFGSLLGNEFFLGRGPKIPILLQPEGMVNAELTSLFTEAGINQARHQLQLTVTASVRVILPFSTANADVAAQYVIAETIIVGKTPNAYVGIKNAQLPGGFEEILQTNE